MHKRGKQFSHITQQNVFYRSILYVFSSDFYDVEKIQFEKNTHRIFIYYKAPSTYVFLHSEKN